MRSSVLPIETIDLDGARIAYWDRGTGLPLVFVHGVGTSGEIWQGDLAELASECRLIVYDRRGYGASDRPPRDWSAHLRDASALIEALDAAPALVVGYSGGAVIALHLALDRPDLVAGLVLLDPAVNIARCITPGFLRALATAQLLRRVRGERQGAERWMRYVASYPTGGSAFDRATADRREKLLKNASGVFADGGAASERVDEDRLRGVEVPVTLIEAQLSPPFLRRSCDRLRRSLPAHARAMTLEHSGHAVGMDAQEELLDALRDSLRLVSAAQHWG